jgi:hypothetical protein
MKLELKIFIDIFGTPVPCEEFTYEKVGVDVDFFNELLKELFVEEYCYGDKYTEYNVGTYLAEFEIINDIDYSYDGRTDDTYFQIKKIKEIK